MSSTPLKFDRPIPLFPLPNCVLFPGVVQPLHIFEPRYRDMMEETLEDQSAIAMALLKPGWEKLYYGRPPVFEILCAGRIVAHERLEDGKFNLLLHGLTRARLLREEKRGLYRVGYLEPVLEPVNPTGEPVPGAFGGEGCSHAKMQRKVLKEMFEKTSLRELTVAPMVATLFDEEAPLGRLVDTLAFTLVQDPLLKQQMLEQLDPLLRGELLLRELVSLAAKLGTEVPIVGAAKQEAWPPPMGVN
jgi:Lon protease-like protein